MHTDDLQNNLQADFRYFLTAVWAMRERSKKRQAAQKKKK
jgi:hypothetical protein